jgi:hypothetical protein
MAAVFPFLGKSDEYDTLPARPEPLRRSILDILTEQPIQFGGRTDATVTTSCAPMQKIETESGISYVKNPQCRIIKAHSDPRITEIEYNIYKRLRSQGLPVAEAYDFDGTKLAMEEVDGQPFTNAIRDIWAPIHMGLEDGTYAVEKFSDLFTRATHFTTLIDLAVDNALLADEKEYLARKQLDNLAHTFSIDPAAAKEHEHAYRIMQGLDIRDPEFIPLCAPLEDLLKKGEEKYGMWSWGCDVRNILVTPGGTLLAIDFNNLRKTALQTSDAYLLDAYLPLKSVRNTLVYPTPFSESEKWQFIGYKARVLNQLAPEKRSDDPLEYAAHFRPARIVRNIRQFGHAMKEYEKSAASNDIYGQYDALSEAIYAASLADKQLGALAHDDPALRLLGEYVHNHLYQRSNPLKETYKKIEQTVHDIT